MTGMRRERWRPVLQMNDVRVCFFARLREVLGEREISVGLADEPTTVAQLLEQLALDRGERWAEALGDSRLVIAINQQVSSRDSRLKAGDELAVFPPVTGG